MKRNIITVFSACILTCMTAYSQTITLFAEGTKQGKFKGESTRPKFEDKTEINGYFQEVNSPRDAASGLASGKKVYQPVILLKKTGASSPQFFQALTTNEVLKKVVIDFYKPDPSGMELQYYTVTLENVLVSGFKQYTGPIQNEKFDPDNNTMLYDEIKLTFQKITIEEKTGKTMAADESDPRRQNN